MDPDVVSRRRLPAESASVLDPLARLESMWVDLQRGSRARRLAVDVASVLLEAIEALVPTVAAAIWRTEDGPEASRWICCRPEGLMPDVEAEAARLHGSGAFGLAVDRRRPTVVAPGGIQRAVPRIRSIVLVPLGTLRRLVGVVLVASEREPGELSGQELRLLSLLAGQAALELDGAGRESELRRQKRALEDRVRARTRQLLDSHERVEGLTRDLALEMDRARAVQERLERAERTRESFLASVSHELRTPLSAMLGSIDVVREEWSAEIPGEARDMLEVCQRNGLQLLALVSDLLDVTAVRSGHTRIQPADVELARLAHEICASLDPLARERGVALRPRIRRDVSVRGDAARLRQVLAHLVRNAVQFSRPERGFVRLGARRCGDHVVLTVCDNGVGIPADQIPRIFDPFARADEPASRREPGTGLGLAICQSLVEAHGGSIAVESAVGRGTRFLVSLPRA